MTVLRTLILSTALALTSSAALASDGEIGRADQDAAREVQASSQGSARGGMAARPQAGVADYRALTGARTRTVPTTSVEEPQYFKHASGGNN